jgi:hypothetical protein
MLHVKFMPQKVYRQVPLTDETIRAAKPKDKPYKLTDEKGLYLLISVVGGKLWRFDYRYDGKRKTLAFGKYPDVGLKEARERSDEARKLRAFGMDPGEAIKRKATTLWRERIHETASARFLIDNEGALFIDAGMRRLTLTPDETDELRTFLSATQTLTARR